MSKEEKVLRHQRQQAVALRYGAEDNAPRVVASGAGHIASRIIELAKAHGVPVRTDDNLVQILSSLEVGYQIPPETYRAVAEILAFLFRTDTLWRNKKRSEDPKMFTKNS